MAKDTPSKARIAAEKVAGALLPGADGKFYTERAKRHEGYRAADQAAEAAKADAKKPWWKS